MKSEIIFLLLANTIANYRTDSFRSQREKRATTQANVNTLFSRYFSETGEVDGTYYGKSNTAGHHCSIANPPPIFTQPGMTYVAAANGALWQNSLTCGACFRITGTGRGLGANPIAGTYIGIVTDSCPGCKTYDIDFGLVGDGRWKIHHHAISCPDVPASVLATNPTANNIKFRFDGSNPWYLKIMVTNAKLPTVGLELLHNYQWRCMTRSLDNHFIIQNIGKIPFPIRVRMTSIAGEVKESTIRTIINNNVDIDSGVQYRPIKDFYPSGTPSPPNIACHGQGGISTPYVPKGTSDTTRDTDATSHPSLTPSGISSFTFCEAATFGIVIRVNSIAYRNPSLIDHTCKPTINATHIVFSTSFSSCGTFKKEDNDNVIFENEARLDGNSKEKRIKFKCSYGRSGQMSVNSEIVNAITMSTLSVLTAILK